MIGSVQMCLQVIDTRSIEFIMFGMLVMIIMCCLPLIIGWKLEKRNQMKSIAQDELLGSLFLIAVSAIAPQAQVGRINFPRVSSTWQMVVLTIVVSTVML